MPWWGLASSLLAPVLLIGGWIAGAALQPVPFNSVAKSISALASQGMPYRWLITVALLGVGACHVVTGLALRQATDAGRIMLISGGLSGMVIAANPQHIHSGAPVHEIFSVTGVLFMMLWPLAGMRADSGAPAALRPRAAWSYGLFTLGLLLWFTAELFGGDTLGLAERAITADQSFWPLVVVLSVLIAQRRPVAAAEYTAAFRFR